MPMYPPNMFFTSESVTEGHPDKLCDQVSDAVLDACLTQDPESRVACETYVTLGMMMIGGEITTRAQLDVDGLVRRLGSDIGYSSPLYGYDVNTAGHPAGVSPAVTRHRSGRLARRRKTWRRRPGNDVRLRLPADR